jgi:hypothetical protein
MWRHTLSGGCNRKTNLIMTSYTVLKNLNRQLFYFGQDKYDSIPAKYISCDGLIDICSRVVDVYCGDFFQPILLIDQEQEYMELEDYCRKKYPESFILKTIQDVEAELKGLLGDVQFAVIYYPSFTVSIDNRKWEIQQQSKM